MLKDQERVNAIIAALDESIVDDGIHCELGVGTGIFAIYAAKRCRQVYAIEQDPKIFEIAEKNILSSGLSHKITLIQGDALDFHPSDKVDTLFAEMMSIWGINEPQIPVMNHGVSQVLKENGRSVPKKIINLVELGYYDFTVLGVECKASIPQFSGIPKPRIVTRSFVFNEFDFSKPNAETISHAIPIHALASTRINCARLSSIVQLSDTITYYASDSLMPQTIIPLNEIAVKAGEQLRFSASFKVRSSIEESRFELTKL